MNTSQSFIERLPYPILSIGFSLSIGLAIPVFYEWSNGSQIYGRELKLLRATWLTLAITLVATVAWLCWKYQMRPAAGHPIVEGDALDLSRLEPKQNIQFSIRGLFVATTIVAFLMAFSSWIPRTWYGPIALILILGILSWSIFMQRSALMRVICWLAVVYLPFAWVVPFSKPFGSVSGMLDSLPIFPALIPGIILGRLFDQHPNDGPGLFIVTVIALTAGFFAMRLGGKTSSCAIVFAFVSSCLSSMLFHVMYRA